MRCNDLQDQINAFAAGDLAPLRAWRLRRHLGRCPVCNGRLQQARKMNLGLIDLGIAAPSEALRQRVCTELEFLASRAAEEEFVWHEHRRLRRRKRLYALAGALTAIPLTGVMVNGLIQLREYLRPQSKRYTYKDSMGRTWRLSGTFIGGLGLGLGSVQDPMIRSVVFTLGDDPNGVLDIDVAGEHFEAQGNGPHLLYSKRSGFLGTVYITTGAMIHRTTQPQIYNYKTIRKHIAPVADDLDLSVRGCPGGVEGTDRTTQTTWRLRGSPAWVQVQRPGDSKPAAEIYTGPPSGGPKTALHASPVRLLVSDRKEPTLTWTVHGHVGTATGYGVYPLRDETGRVVLILRAGRR